MRHCNGLSAGLYRAIYDYVLKSPDISELTVEDPSEDFEDLRDRCDLRMLLCHKKFMKEAYAGKKILSTEGAKPKKPLTGILI
jgi:histone acetyltransferase 1